MYQFKIPDHVLDDLKKFISENYANYLPNSLFIAQAFISEYPHHGKKFDVFSVNYAVESVLKTGFCDI